MQYAAIFKGCKNGNFQRKNSDIFSYFLLKTKIVGTEAVLTSTHNLCFRAKIRKNVYPFKRQFYCIKVECKGVLLIRACLHDV